MHFVANLAGTWFSVCVVSRTNFEIDGSLSLKGLHSFFYNILFWYDNAIILALYHAKLLLPSPKMKIYKMYRKKCIVIQYSKLN